MSPSSEQLQPLFSFTSPSGHSFTIREQNGNDDDILSNSIEAKYLMNLSRFISAIVVKTDYTSSGSLTPEEAHSLPSLDRYCILFQSRVFSYGNELEFSEDWGDRKGIIEYAQDLNDFLFDYSIPAIKNEEINLKPNAIPYYPLGKTTKDIQFSTESGKSLMIDLLTGEGEAWALNLPIQKQTKNANLMARNLRLLIGSNWEKVTNFSSFSSKDMRDIRRFIRDVDPIFQGVTDIEYPETGEVAKKYILTIDDFFYPGEI